MSDEKPHKPGGEGPPPKKKAGPAYEDFSDAALLEWIKSRLPEAVTGAQSYLGLNYLLTVPAQLIPLARLLKEERSYTLLEDLTAADYPDREKRFDLIYILYSFDRNDRLVLKLQVADGEPAPSLTALWNAANWAEREVYDMFGISFEGHPDLKRILLPHGWQGYPLRKEYDIEKQDEEWIAANMTLRAPQSLLGIPSFKEIEHMRKQPGDEKA